LFVLAKPVFRSLDFVYVPTEDVDESARLYVARQRID